VIKRFVPWVDQFKRPRAVAPAKETPHPLGDGLTLASYNIHKCVGTDGAFDPVRVKKAILALDADVIALQEVDARFGDRRGLMDLDYLHRQGGYRSIFENETNSVSHGWHGNVILFRAGIVHHVHQITLPGLEPRGAIIVDFGFGAASFRLISAHLGLLRRSRMQQVAALVHAADPHPRRHVIIVGDMNEWRLERRSALNLLHDHFDEVSARLPSFPSRFPILPLDRLFVSKGLHVDEMSVVDTTLTRVASDHLPIRARISVVHGASAVETSEPARDSDAPD
jgi:endonuclease/exonuclease/phosphatase family metal-dependent hydrolase